MVVEDASKVHPFPCPTTYRTALTHYLDITSPPRTNVLKELIEYATQDADKEFLKKISSPNQEGQVLFYTYLP
jgi:NADPH-ferrihemoprotein reductase